MRAPCLMVRSNGTTSAIPGVLTLTGLAYRFHLRPQCLARGVRPNAARATRSCRTQARGNTAADVAGYSRLMYRRGRHSAPRDTAWLLMHSWRSTGDGSSEPGDGVLFELPSVVDAVECAVAVQAVMAQRNEGCSGPQDAPKDRDQPRRHPH
jgi:hypothetical protein